MGELARRRSARDLWISRGHLWAAGTGTVLLVITAFSAGVLVGGGDRAHASGVSATQITLEGAPDDSLIELLARVEANAETTGGTTALTYPDVLSGEPVERAVPTEPPVTKGSAVVSPAPVVVSPSTDLPPPGRHTVAVLRTPDPARAAALRDQLRARDLPAWVGAERVDGQLAYRVALGGFPDEATARGALTRFQATVEDVPLIAGGTVEPIR